jgi:hypothetical protein
MILVGFLLYLILRLCFFIFSFYFKWFYFIFIIHFIVFLKDFRHSRFSLINKFSFNIELFNMNDFRRQRG